MRSLTTTLAASAAVLLPIVAAVPDPNTVQLGFHKRKVDAKTSPARLARRQTANAAISNQIIGYFINVEVGTPGQNITLQLDTGSSDIWFPSSTAQFCQSTSQGGCINSYDQSASTSAQDATDLGDFSISYVDGTQISGAYILDTLKIGDSTTLTNLTMASATDTELGYGIMGVGFDTDESILGGGVSTAAGPYPNVIDVLVSEGKINTRAYSLWLDDLESNTGSILFGGVDSDKYTGDLIAIPIQKDSQSMDYTSFSVAWTGLSIKGSKQNSNLNPSSPQSVILDSGTTDLYLPDDIANNILQGVGAVQDGQGDNLVPCNLKNDDLTFGFQFGGSNGPTINVPLSEFVLEASTTTGEVPQFESGPYKGQDICLFGVFAAGDIPLLFGDTFMRSAYIVYDLDNLEIGLAQANTNGNSGTGNVKAFSASTGPIPNAKTTVADVTVTQTFSGTEQPGVIQTSATNVGQETGVGSPTFALVTGTASTSSGSGSSSHSSSAAGAVTIPSTERSAFAVIGVTLAAFFFGTMLL